MIPVTSTHIAVLTVPVSPADGIIVTEDTEAHTVRITAPGNTPQEARAKIRDFLDAARAAAQE
jgi:hypothetical protein